MCKSLDEGTVEIKKTYGPPYFRDIFGRGPSVDSCHFYRVHACHPLFKDYPQVIHGWRMEEAFFQFEVYVVVFGNLEYVLYCGYMVGHVSTCCDANVVHVYVNRGALEFVFENDITVDVVHHGLECGWRVCETEIHYCGLE